MDTLFFLAVPLAAGLIMLALMAYIFYSIYLDFKKRTQQLQLVATDLGLEFVTQGKQAFLARLKNFPGASKQFSNLMLGRTKDLEVAIFDYQIGSGEDGSYQTAVCFRSDGVSLPDFSLRPEHLGHKLSAWVGFRDINFDTHPRFSQSYFLRGRDEDAIRALFTSKVLDFYQQKPGLCTECNDNSVLFYRQNDKVKPEKIRALMEDGFAVLALFRPVETN